MILCSTFKRAALIVALSVAPLASAGQAQAEVMTVQQLRDMIAQKGDVGELAATSYFQGVVEGMMAMETMRRNGGIREKEFCKLLDGSPEDTASILHPAYRAKEVIAAWERQGQPMNTVAPDVVLSFLSSQYGC